MSDLSNNPSIRFFNIFLFLIVMGVSSVVTMTTGEYTNPVTEESGMVGPCMQLLTPSFQKIFDLDQICRELDRYLACYVFDVRKFASFYPGPLPLDLFHDVHSTNTAYQGVCQDLRVITPNRHCVRQKEEELRQCNDQLNAVSSHLENNYYDVGTSTQYLCSAFQEHASCESIAFTACDPDLGHAMANFYIAALPTACKILLGVSSKYDDIIFGPFWMGIPVECFPRGSDQAYGDEEDYMSTTFSKLCRHHETFIPCLEEVIEKRNRTGLLYDVSAYDLFDARSQMNAYKAFCPYVKEFSTNLECVHRTNITVSEQCSSAYNEAAYKMDTADMSLQDKRNIMCRATVDLLRCERQAYVHCSEDIISAYNNYNVAILPEWCKSLTAITSPFDDETTTINTSTVVTSPPTVPITTTTTTPPRYKTRPERITNAVTNPSTEMASIKDNKTPLTYKSTYMTINGQQNLRTSGVLISLVMTLLSIVYVT